MFSVKADNHRSPKNSNQRLAIEYRNRQLVVLHSAKQPITARLNSLTSSSSFCTHTNHLVASKESQKLCRPEENEVEMLSLECAFDWLRINHLEIYTPLVQSISDDQEEPLPLNWAVLVEDWDRTYWIVWLCIIIMVFSDDGRLLTYSTVDFHGPLRSWVDYIKKQVFPSFCPK